MNLTTTITLAGKKWSLPLHEEYKEKIFTPSLVRIVKFVNAGEDAVLTLDTTISNLGDAEFDFLEDVISTVLIEAHPEITRDDLLDMPITPIEMLLAVLMIANDLDVIEVKQKAIH